MQQAHSHQQTLSTKVRQYNRKYYKLNIGPKYFYVEQFSRDCKVNCQATGVSAVKKYRFPFTRIAGQEEMKLGLILNVIDPNVGGVLILGDRGTGKSVTVRSLIDLLPPIDAVVGDQFNSDPYDPKAMAPDVLARYSACEKLPVEQRPTPLVELPLGATEDRICGTLDIERALNEAVKCLEPGLLAKANRGIMYIDEVNLLEDGLVDVVLDSAASGVNTVEREGVSLQHPAKFIMIGSGNPEEGELRPQLLDRFGLSVQVGTLMDKDDRLAMLMDKMEYDSNAQQFCLKQEDEMRQLKDRINKAREILNDVVLPRDIALKIADVCSQVGVEGLRGDLVVNRASKAFVAYNGGSEVTMDDVEKVLKMCLNHRLRKDPLDPLDNSIKVARIWDRVKNPEKYKKMEEAKKKKEEEAKKAAEEAGKDGEAAKPSRGNMKKGAWAGLG